MPETTNIYVECPKLPEIEIPKITLPLGGELSAFADFSVCTPDSCTLTFNLMAQIAPLLGSITCLIEVLGVIAALKEFATSPLAKGPDLLEAIEKAGACITFAMPPYINILLSIKSSLKLITNFLGCLLSQLDNLSLFHKNLDFEAAEGNPILQASIDCALSNAQTSMNNTKQSLKSVDSLLQLINTLLGIAVPGQQPIELKLSTDINDSTKTMEEVDAFRIKLRDAVDILNQTINSLP